MAGIFSVKLGRLLKTWALNLRSSLYLILSGGKRAFHEGQYRNGVWSDWSRSYSCRPAHYHEPTTEAEICRIVAAATKVRVVGSGHSFNDATLTDQTLICLDRYNKVVLREHPTKAGWKIAVAQAGVRLRDLTAYLWEHGASTSIGGS